MAADFLRFSASAIVAGLSFVSCSPSVENESHLFVLSGQSNMVGLDPAASFTPTVEETFGRKNVIVIKDAESGAPIRRWVHEGKLSGTRGDLYDRLIRKVDAGIQGRRIGSVTLIWMQGEEDAFEGSGEVYAANLKRLINQLANDLGREDLNFVIGRLSDFDLINEEYSHWTMIRKAQVAMAEASPRGAWVDTDDLNDGKNRTGGEIRNFLHYRPDSYEILGRRFAEAAIELIHLDEFAVSEK